MTKRKKRSDRNHLIYGITCETTGEQYIGVTVVKKSAQWKTLYERWQGHLYKAYVTQEQWELPTTIRKYGYEAFSLSILDVVRGKKAAFAAEAALINNSNTTLNTRKKQSA